MNAMLLTSLLLVGAPDELEALQTAVQAAVTKAGPSVVRIETVGGVRKVAVPDRFKKRMSTPERPGEDEARPERGQPEPKPGDENQPPGGRTPRFRNEFEKMLAQPGFKKAEGPTTGLVVSADGYILSSAWNFESNPSVISVTLAGGKTYAAEILGIDRAASLALLKIDAQDLPVPTFIDPRTVREGAWAFALGRALGRDGVEVKYGIISAKNRINGNALQTDAATSPTNYGGPLIDVEGRVYGVIVPLGSRGNEANPNWYDSGIGFAVPLFDVKRLIERLGKPGVVLQPAFLGVQMDQDRAKTGAKITNVIKGHAAEKAGLKAGDVVTDIDGEPVRNAFTLRFAIGRSRAGDKAKLKVQRGAEELVLEVEFGPRPKAPTKKKVPIPMPGMDKPKRPDKK
jgi:serine protease Do